MKNDLKLSNVCLSADSQSMVRFSLAAILFSLGTSLIGAEPPLFWALANNDAIETWALTQTAPSQDPFLANGLSASEWAVARGSAEAMTILAWRGVPLNLTNERGQNLLFQAASLGRLDLMATLESKGARWDQRDSTGNSLIHFAVGSPHEEVLFSLLARGLSATSRSDSGVTPLMLACQRGKLREAETLLRYGAIPEDEDYLGRSVHDYAVVGGDSETLALIEGAVNR